MTPPMTMNSLTTTRLSLPRKVGYASGNFGKTIVWSTLEYFFLFFLTDLWGLPPDRAGFAIMIMLIWDGVSGPVMGYVADRTRSRFGKYGPYLLFGAPACGATFTILFHNPGWESESVFWYALGSGILFRSFYTMCDVPHNAMLARISEGSRDASLLSGLRFFFSSTGALTVSIAAAVLFSSPSVSLQEERFQLLATVAGCIYVAAIWVAWVSTKHLDRNQPNSSASVTFSQGMSLLVVNRPFLLLLAIAFFHAMLLPVFAKSLAYYAKHVIGNEIWTSTALVALTTSQAISIGLWIFAARRGHKGRLQAIAYGTVAIGLVGWLLCSHQPMLRLVFIVPIGLGLGGANMFMWARLPDVIEYGETFLGQRIEALPTSIFLLALKFGAGAASAILGMALSSAGYEPHTQLPAEFSSKMILIMTTIPLIGTFICAGIALAMRIYDKDL